LPLRRSQVQYGCQTSHEDSQLQLLDLPPERPVAEFFPAGKFTLVIGENALTTYEFNAHKIQHRFYMVCGSQPFASGKNPDGSEMGAVNLRCVPSVKLESLDLQYFDGASK
jgi:hypothetical protein